MRKFSIKKISQLFTIISCMYGVTLLWAQDTELTEWLSMSELNELRIQKNDDRLLPSHIEGRLQDGKIFYRATFSPFPKDMTYYYSYWGMTDHWYERYSDEFLADGYKELFHSVFKDQVGTDLHQATWVLVGEAPKSAWEEFYEMLLQL